MGQDGEEGVGAGRLLAGRTAEPVGRTTVLGLVEVALHVPAPGKRLKYMRLQIGLIQKRGVKQKKYEYTDHLCTLIFDPKVKSGFQFKSFYRWR